VTDKEITKERNIFLISFFISIFINVIFQILVSSDAELASSQPNEIAKWGILITKGVFIYLVYRLSRFLKKPVWLIALYCILTPFAVLYLIPVIGLLLDVRKARKMISVTQNLPAEETT
jgi:hypothetical protein